MRGVLDELVQVEQKDHQVGLRAITAEKLAGRAWGGALGERKWRGTVEAGISRRGSGVAPGRDESPRGRHTRGGDEHTG